MTKNNESNPTTYFENEPKDLDFRIGGFELWIFGRQFPESEDYSDGNWLDVMARCTAGPSVVIATGSILHLSELHALLTECKRIHDTLTGEATLECMEPNLGLKIKMESGGHCQLTVSITPDPVYQNHTFIFDLDQTYLQPLIAKLELILRSYPLKGVDHDSPSCTSHQVDYNKQTLRLLFKTIPIWLKRGISWLVGS